MERFDSSPPHVKRRRKPASIQVWQRIKKGWDVLIADALLVIYGISAFIQTPASLASAPEMYVTLFNGEFILTGILLVIGLLLDSYNITRAGLILYNLNIAVLAGIVIFASGSVVSILIFSMAVRGAVMYRALHKTKVKLEETHKLTAEIKKIGDDMRE